MNRVAGFRSAATAARTAASGFASPNLVPATAAGSLDGQVLGGCAPIANSRVTPGPASAGRPKETMGEKEMRRDDD
jgi:hypothetical protein